MSNEKTEARKASELNDLLALQEKVQDWIVEVSQKDNGKVFWAAIPDDKLTLVNYGDLRKLINIVG